MSHTIETRAVPIERLLVSLLGDRSQLAFSCSILPGRCVFRVGTSAALMGRLVGYNGTHLRSLQLIAQLIGNTMEQEWVMKLEEPTDTRRVPKQAKPDPDEHDATDDALLLADVLEACGVSANVESRGGIAGGFDLDIIPSRQEDNAALLDPHEALFTEGQRDRAPLNLVTALRSIMRAVGKAQGIEYRIQIA